MRIVKKRAECTQESAARLTVQQQRQEKEFPDARAIRLDRMSALQQQRLATESPASRLDHMSVLKHQRLATELPEKRTARLDHMSAYSSRD